MSKTKLVTSSVFALLLFFGFAYSVHAQVPRTSTVYSLTSGSGGVDFYPYFSGDRKTLYVDFESPSLANMEYIYYNLNYDTYEEATLRGVEEKFVPAPADFKYFRGRSYIRKKLITGYCSGITCVYYRFPHDLRMTVTSKLKGAASEVTKVYSIKY